MSLDTRRTFNLGRDHAGRLMCLIEADRDRFVLVRQAGNGEPRLELSLTASQIRDMAFLAKDR